MSDCGLFSIVIRSSCCVLWEHYPGTTLLESSTCMNYTKRVSVISFRRTVNFENWRRRVLQCSLPRDSQRASVYNHSFAPSESQISPLWIISIHYAWIIINHSRVNQNVIRVWSVWFYYEKGYVINTFRKRTTEIRFIVDEIISVCWF